MRCTRIQTTEQNYQKIGKGNSSVATLNIIVTLRICIFQYFLSDASFLNA